MTENQKKVIEELFNRLYGETNKEYLELLISQIKGAIELIPNFSGKISYRIKSPTSILKKVLNDQTYSTEWNKMKDLVGFMVVVDTNEQVDQIIDYFQSDCLALKNPNSSGLIRDYRTSNYREVNGYTSDVVRYDPPSNKGYQTSNGYKNCRANLMIDGYPIEIQIKTKEQYIAHEATHDPIYKSSELSSTDEKTEVSGRIFPYFEALAHFYLHKDKMTPGEIGQCLKDIDRIYQDNKEYFANYKDVYAEAGKVFAIYTFYIKNQEQIEKNNLMQFKSFSLKLFEIEMQRIIRYLEFCHKINYKKTTKKVALESIINKVSNMSFEEFEKLRDLISDSYKFDECEIKGVFDEVSCADLDLLKQATHNFKTVDVVLFDDELAAMMNENHFPFENRKDLVKQLGIASNISKVGIEGDVKLVEKGVEIDLDKAIDGNRNSKSDNYYEMTYSAK